MVWHILTEFFELEKITLTRLQRDELTLNMSSSD